MQPFALTAPEPPTPPRRVRDVDPDVAHVPQSRGCSMACPHCGSYAIVRSSHLLSPLFRERIYQCTNWRCSFTYVVGMEVLRGIAPSHTPNPAIAIPMAPAAGVAATHSRVDP